MPYNPLIHHRRSIRLKGYDYSQAGLYFITICTQHRACLFGEISNGEMHHNDAGRMVEKWYRELENKFPHLQCHEMVVMPNHFHCIAEIAVRAHLRVRPNDLDDNEKGAHAGAPLPAHVGNSGDGRDNTDVGDVGADLRVRPIVESRDSIPTIVQWFKTMTTNEYIRGVKSLGWQPFDGQFWQRDYYEHIIRNAESCERVVDYIVTNPSKWAEDKLNGSAN